MSDETKAPETPAPVAAPVAAAPKPKPVTMKNGARLIGRTYAKLALLMTLPFVMFGCSFVHGVADGITGAAQDATDSVTGYHIGQLIVPVISKLLQIFRMFVGI